MGQKEKRLKEGGFSIHGYKYYSKRELRFAYTSISKLLLTREEKGATKSITRAVKMVMDKKVSAIRNGKTIKLRPVTQLRKNDVVTIKNKNGEMSWIFNGKKLIRYK